MRAIVGARSFRIGENESGVRPRCSGIERQGILRSEPNSQFF